MSYEIPFFFKKEGMYVYVLKYIAVIFIKGKGFF